MFMDQYISQMDKIIDGLYLGDIQGASNLMGLKKKGITHILQVAAGFQPFFPGEFQYMVVNVLDMPYENLIRHFKPAVAFIKDAIRSGGTVLVHCFAGISRSASVVIAYLMKELGLPMLDALTYTRKRRPIVFPNPGFQKQLFEFEKHLRQNYQKTMIEYQEKKRKKISEQVESVWDKKSRATASFDGALKKQTLEGAKNAYAMYDSHKQYPPKQQNLVDKNHLSHNSTAKQGDMTKYFTPTTEAQTPNSRPLTQHKDKKGNEGNKMKDFLAPKQGSSSVQQRNFELSGNQDLRVKKILSSTENSPQPRNQGTSSQNDAQKIKQQMSQTQAGHIMGFQGHVNLESSYKRDFSLKPLELAISMNQKKQTVSNTPNKRDFSNERNSNDNLKGAPQRSTGQIHQNDLKEKNKNSQSVSQQYFYQVQKDKSGRHSEANRDQQKPPLMAIQKTLPNESQHRGSTTLQTDARRLAALGALPSSYLKTDKGSLGQHDNIPTHPKLFEQARKGDTIKTPPPQQNLKQHHNSSLNNTPGKDRETQKLILQEKGGFMIKQLPPQSSTGLNSFDNRNLRDASMRKRY